MSLRVLMVAACPFPVLQGSQALISETARALQSISVNPTILTYGYGAGDADGVRVVRPARVWGMRKTKAGPSCLKPVADVMLRVALQRLMRSESFDVIHAHNYEGLWVALSAQSVLPVVYHAHNAMVDELPYFLPMKRFSRKLGYWLDCTLPARADHIIALHQRLADYLVDKGCQKDNITVLPPTCDTEAFLQRPKPSPSFSGSFVLYAGNLDAYQNLDLLRHAMARVRTILPGARLHVATSDRADVPWADHVYRITNFAALREVLAQDCVVACPRVSWSGYPIKIVNAMAAGRPIVACRSSAHSLQHMRNGYIVEDNDCVAFAEGLVLLLRDPVLRRRLGKEARRTACERHNLHGYATALMEVYDRARANWSLVHCANIHR